MIDEITHEELIAETFVRAGSMVTSNLKSIPLSDSMPRVESIEGDLAFTKDNDKARNLHSLESKKVKSIESAKNLPIEIEYTKASEVVQMRRQHSPNGTSRSVSEVVPRKTVRMIKSNRNRVDNSSMNFENKMA